MRRITFALVFLFGGMARAIPTGSWRGPAEYASTGNAPTVSEMRLRIALEGDRLEVEGGLVPELALKIENDVLTFQRKRVGFVTKSSIVVEKLMVLGTGIPYRLKFQVKDSGSADVVESLEMSDAVSTHVWTSKAVDLAPVE